MDIITYTLSKKYTDKQIASLIREGFKVQVEQNRDILNSSGEEKVFYFLPKTPSKPKNGYDEYLYVNNDWEQVGSTDIDLSAYALKNEIPIKVSQLQNDSGYLTEHQDISGKADKATTLAGYGITDGQQKINSNNKLSSDLIDDSNQTNKFVTTNEKTTWNAKYDKPSGGIPFNDLSQEIQNQLSTILSTNSPNFTGIPTAPTASRGTNTTQIATTAFVQEAIKPALLITITDLPVNTVITATATLVSDIYEYSVSKTSNEAGVISFPSLEYTGQYRISYNDNHIRGHKDITIDLPSVYTLGARWFDLVTYTIIIDKTNSNTATACTYEDSAEGMIKGSSTWDERPIFRDIKPCIFKDGQVQYYLNPNDWTKKENSDEASDLTGIDGDVMIEFPKFAYKIKTVDNLITISVSNDDVVIENDSDYTYDAFSRLEEGDLDYFYKGAFKGSLDENGKLRSLPGKIPANNKNIGAFRTTAQSNGSHYQQSTYAQLKALQCLYLIKYGDRNSQSAVGNGVVNASAAYITGYNTTSLEEISSENSTLASGMTFGTTENGITHMRLFGIEDFWGSIWEWVDGLTTDANRNIITSWNSFSNEGITATTISTTSGLTANGSGYINDVAGNTSAGFMPILFGNQNGINASSSTAWADHGALSASCVLYFGGGWSNGDLAGAFVLLAYGGASDAYAYFGARLSYA